MSEGYLSESKVSLAGILRRSEEAEESLSYSSEEFSENSRRESGSYYTPIDVAEYFWDEFFRRCNIDTQAKAEKFLSSHTFVEPAVGSGVLLFALFQKLLEMNVNPKAVTKASFTVVDLNDSAIRFVKAMIGALESSWKTTFTDISYVVADFRHTARGSDSRPVVFFGNPPFVATEKGSSKWKNTYAEFLELAVSRAGKKGAVQFIVPLSITFSRDYRMMRELMRDSQKAVFISNFDNIPDTLFKAGKPRNANTNKANSQRCSIITLLPSSEHRLFSSPLLRWSRRDRKLVLKSPTPMLDAGKYRFDDQFPRPANEKILRYLSLGSANAARLGDLAHKGGKHSLFIAGVARNFIGIRPEQGGGTVELRFNHIEEKYRAMILVSSDLFFDYWLTVGDGFHVTRGNLLEFPISKSLMKELVSTTDLAKTIWKKRDGSIKRKLNAGSVITTYDFSELVPSLYDLERP